MSKEVQVQQSCYLDCYMIGDLEGFPTATYEMPNGYYWKVVASYALKHFDRIALVKETNGQSIQPLPSEWRFGKPNLSDSD